MPSAMMLFAPGFEEIEAITVVDLLRRCNIEVDLVGIESSPIGGAHKVKLVMDKTIDEISAMDYDAILMPGGSPGYENLRKDQQVLSLLNEAFNANKVIGAICAAPAVLSDAGVLSGKECTIYPGLEEELEKGGGTFKEEAVVADGNIITSRGPATAFPFALNIAEILAGEEIAEKVKKKTLADTTFPASVLL